jgi:formylglycine-generating enzyme required for sulfatase activity
MSDDATQDRLRRWLAPPLIVFVLISIGFALGRLSAPSGGAGSASAAPPGEATRVIVRYFHGDIRCVTCNDLERVLQYTLEKHYVEAQRAGSLVYEEINFDRDATLAKRYDVSTSMPVIAWEIDGAEAGAETLVAVWERLDDEQELETFLVAAIDRAAAAAGLGELTGGGS